MKPFTRIAVLALLAFCGGCLVNAHSDTEQTGNYVSPSTLGQIEVGKTTSAWVRAVLGEPTSVIGVDATTQILRYSYTETKDSSGAVFLIFRGSDRKVSTSSVFVEIRDGVVSRTWRG